MSTKNQEKYSEKPINTKDAASIQAAEDEIVADFDLFEDWTDKYAYIIDQGKKLPEFPEECKTEENKIRGCQSQVWFVADHNDGKITFLATSDAAIVSGLIALLLKVYSGRTPESILANEPTFIDKIGLGAHLSPTRNNGLASMVRAIHNMAAKALQ